MFLSFKIFLSALLAALLFSAFSDNDSGQTEPVIFIKDTNQYSQAFIKKLTGSNYAKSYALIDSFLILNNTDTFKFPEYIKPKRSKLFIALGYLETDSMFDIHLKQLNYTNLQVEFNILDRNQNNFKHLQKVKGIAELNTNFILGKKKQKDPKTGETYWADTYTFNEKDCEYTVYIGRRKWNELGVKIERICKDKSKNIAADDNPEFWEK